jgi:hypothetical protein
MKFIDAEVVLCHTRRIGFVDSVSVFEYPGMERDEKKLLGGVRFWNGKNWVSSPTVNSSYMEAAGVEGRPGDNHAAGEQR